MTRPSLLRSPEDRITERDNKPWHHHTVAADLILTFHKPTRDVKLLQGLIDQHRPFAIVSLKLLGEEVLVIDAEYLTSVHFFYIPLESTYSNRRLFKLKCDFPLTPSHVSL